MEHHDLFKDLYPDRSLISKHHSMIHICGSSDLRQSTGFSQILKNFKNITKCVANEHQIPRAYHWEIARSNRIGYGPLKLFNVDNEDSSDVFAQA